MLHLARKTGDGYRRWRCIRAEIVYMGNRSLIIIPSSEFTVINPVAIKITNTLANNSLFMLIVVLL